MGIMRIYTVYDEKSEEYSPPFFTLNDKLAKRTINESAKGNGSMLGQYPEDYKLYYIGMFDNATGVMSEDKVLLVASVVQILSEYKKKEVQ